jgi:hypothetical protein
MIDWFSFELKQRKVVEIGVDFEMVKKISGNLRIGFLF